MCSITFVLRFRKQIQNADSVHNYQAVTVLHDASTIFTKSNHTAIAYFLAQGHKITFQFRHIYNII